MKRITIFSLLFLLVITFSFSSSKGEYDVSKYRQDVLNYAMAQVGKKYDQKQRMHPNIFDCSSLVDRASQAAGMNSVTGRDTRSWANTTASMRAGANGKKIPTNQIKAGDAILFNGHVVYAIGPANGCIVPVVHASNSSPYPQGGVKVDKNYNICTNNGGYIGVITAEQVLINNGYTPVNSDGTVAVPPAGVDITGYSQSSNLSLEERYEVSWDAMLEEYKTMLFEGLEKINNGLLTLLALLTVLQILKMTIPYLFGDGAESFVKNVIIVLFKFAFYSYLIKNWMNLMNMMYDIFSKIGMLFLKNSEIKTLDSLFEVSMKECIKVMKLMEEYDFNIFMFIFKGASYFMEEKFFKVMCLGLVLIIIGYFSFRIVFELMVAIIQFYLAVGLSSINLALATNDITKEFGRRPLNTLFGSGIIITINIMMASIVFETLKKASFGDVSLDTLKFQTIFVFVAVGLVMAFLMNKTSDIARRLMGY